MQVERVSFNGFVEFSITCIAVLGDIRENQRHIIHTETAGLYQSAVLENFIDVTLLIIAKTQLFYKKLE